MIATLSTLLTTGLLVLLAMLAAILTIATLTAATWIFATLVILAADVIRNTRAARDEPDAMEP